MKVRCRLHPLVIWVLIALGTTGLQAYDNITWTNAAGGDFQTAGNWNSNSVPGSNAVAIFGLASAPYTVTWSGSITNFAFKVNAGTSTWNLGGFTYYYSNYVANTIGTLTNKVDLTITNGTVTWYGINKATGTTIQGTGTTLRVTGAKVTLHYVNMGVNTAVIAEGTNTMFSSYGYTQAIYGQLLVTNNAYLSAGSGIKIYAGGSVQISGTGSGNTHQTALSVLAAGGVLRMGEGAVVVNSYVSSPHRTPFQGVITMENARYYDAYNDATTALAVSGANAVLQGNNGIVDFRLLENAGGNIWPGGSNSAGFLRARGGFSNSVPGSGTIAIELGGTSTNQYDRLFVAAGSGGAGTFWAGGTLTVSYINGFRPVQKDSFKILDFVSMVGTFDTLDLPGGVKSWDLRNLYTTGEIRFLNPGTMVFTY